ncbi:chloramphenicol resistance protein [Xylariaceae sp. FL0662B]|nr:chloramphenicol resistance protein [Xylariaceae sp. FL0662B]
MNDKDELPSAPKGDHDTNILSPNHHRDSSSEKKIVIPEAISQGEKYHPSEDTDHKMDHESQDDVKNGNEAADLERLSRVSSGPPYSTFSPALKWWIVAMNFFAALVSPFTANIYFPAIPALSESLGVSIGQINLTLTTYMIFQGLSPTIYGDFGDIAGRRPAFIAAFIIFLGANIGLALQRNYTALLILRMLQSGGSSGTIALVYAVVADIAPSSERGKYMGIVGAGITIGPSIGPVIGGLLSQYLGWPSIFWFLVILTAVLLVPYVLAVPETGRKIVGNGSIPPPLWNMTLLDYIRFRRQPRDRSSTPVRQKIPMPNPFHTLAILGQKDMAMILFYNSTLYLAFMINTATISSQFAEIYGYNQLQLGLCFLPSGVACTIASIGNGFLADWNYRRVAKKLGIRLDRKRGVNLGDFPIEKVRIQIVRPLIAVGSAVYIGYAWALDRRVHVAAPLVLSFFIGICVTGSFQIINMLIVDLYPEAPATATAANNLTRCLLGAVATAVIENMIRAMGRGWAFTFIALLFTVFSPFLWVIQKHGPRWRRERLAKMKRAAEKREAAAKEKAKTPAVEDSR